MVICLDAILKTTTCMTSFVLSTLQVSLRLGTYIFLSFFLSGYVFISKIANRPVPTATSISLQ
jgi:hypothetical protein